LGGGETMSQLKTKITDKPLKDYLDSLKTEFSDRVKFLDYCWDVWDYISGYFLLNKEKVLEVPDACIGNASGFMYTWRKDNFYLECEIFEDETIEFFYKYNNYVDSEEWNLGEDISANMLKRLMFFCG
jgi:hypothetical protein